MFVLDCFRDTILDTKTHALKRKTVAKQNVTPYSEPQNEQPVKNNEKHPTTRTKTTEYDLFN